MSNQLQVSGAAKIRDIQGPVVANSGVITALDGAANQYVRGDGTLASFPTSTGGGSSVSYYLNGSVNQGTFGGSTYYQMSKNAIVGTGTNFSTSVNGLLAQFITDANDPDVVSIPSGNWNVEFFMSVSASSGSLASFYVEIYKYDGSTFTLLATNVATPEQLTNTTNVDAYFTSVAMPLSAMAVTDRLAVRIYANVASKTVTLYTEDNRLCQIVTTFSKGMLSLNNLTDQSQYLTVGTSGTDFNIVSSGDTHTFNIPSASASNRGLITTGSQTIAGTKTFNNAINAESGLLLKNGFTTYSNSYTSLGGNIGNLIISGSISSTPFDNELAFTPSTSNTFTFPNASGTLVLLSADQTFTGINSFDYGINYKTGASLANVSGYISQAYAKSGTGAGSTLSLKISDGNSVKAINLDFVGSPATYTYTFPAASGTISLLESTQTFSGVNTFSGTSLILAPSSGDAGILNIKRGAFAGGINDYTSITSQADDLSIVSLTSSTNRSIKFDFSSITSGILRTYTLPNASGTLALLESNQTFTGLNTFSSVANMTATLQVQQGLLLNQGIQANALAPYTAISGYANGLFICPNSGTGYYLVFPTSSSYVYTFPAATGTLALTSNITSAISGTTNYHAKFTGTNTIGNSLIWDNGTNVGIGNTNTSYTLDVSGTGRFTSTLLVSGVVTFRGDYVSFNDNGYIRNDATGWFSIQSGSNGFRVRNAGNGSDYLTIGNTGAATFANSITAGGNIDIGTNAYLGGLLKISRALVDPATSGSADPNYFSRYVDSAGSRTLDVGVSNSGAWLQSRDKNSYAVNYPLLLNPNGGNVGIGTSTPQGVLSVKVGLYRQIDFVEENDSMTLKSTAPDGAYNVRTLTLTGSELYFRTGASSGTSSTERMRITSGGNSIFSASKASEIVSISNTRNSSSGDYALVTALGANANNTNSYHYIAATGGADKFYVYGNGTYTTVSDERLKKNISKVSDTYLDKVLGLNIVNYNWNEQEDGSPLEFGMIAQDVEKLIPSIVHEGREQEDGNIYKGIQASVLPYILIKAIQEMNQQNQDLKSRLDKAGL